MPKESTKWDSQEDWPNWVGRVVEKHSGKPFKSGQTTATVKSFTTNPRHEDRPAFTFEEDDSVVDAVQVRVKP
jgi:hypothetical protein